MTTQVGICNAALIKIGARTIMALDGTSKESRLCTERYDDIRDQVLRDHPWNFATKRATLAQLTETPDFGYTFQYQLPNDCLRVLKVNDNEEDYVIEERKILTDTASVDLIYIARITDPNIYDASFINALSFRLAAELAYPITSSRSLAEDLTANYAAALRKARGNDAAEGMPESLYNDAFIEARL